MSDEKQEEPGVIKPLRIGIRLRPATVTLLYETVNGAKRLRFMPVRGLASYGPVALHVAVLRQRHTKYLEQVN